MSYQKSGCQSGRQTRYNNLLFGIPVGIKNTPFVFQYRILDDASISLIKFWSYGAAAYIAKWVSEGMKVQEVVLVKFLKERMPENIQIDAFLLTSEEWNTIRGCHHSRNDY